MLDPIFLGIVMVLGLGLFWYASDRRSAPDLNGCSACDGVDLEEGQIEGHEYWTCRGCGHISGPGSVWLAVQAEGERFLECSPREQRLRIIDLVVEASLRISSHEKYVPSAAFQRPPMEVLAEMDDQLGETLLRRALSLGTVSGIHVELLDSLGRRPAAEQLIQALIPMVGDLVRTSGRGSTLADYQKSMGVWPAEVLAAFMEAWVGAGLPYEFHNLTSLARRAPDCAVLMDCLDDELYQERQLLALALLQLGGPEVSLQAGTLLLGSEEEGVREALYRAWLKAPLDSDLRLLLADFASTHNAEQLSRSLALSMAEEPRASADLSFPANQGGLSLPDHGEESS